jgi:hypothetical protein
MGTRNRRRTLAGVSLVFACIGHVTRAAPPLAYHQPVQAGWLEKEDITESSGLAPSGRNPDVFWTHNDSGDESRLFAFDRQGRHVGTSQLKRAKNDDWEALDSFQAAGKSYLLIGDVGDNAARRRDVMLYLCEEPEDPRENCSPLAKLSLQYVDGPMDCEAMAFDTERREVLLIEKQIRRFQSRVYVVKWPDSAIPLDDKPSLGNPGQQKPDAPLVSPPASDRINDADGDVIELIAQHHSTVPHFAVTGLDISADNRHLVINTYGDMFVYTRAADENWQAAFRREPIRIASPARRQGEAVCFDHDSLDIVITSEGKSAPLWRVSRQ